jgi:hypothetical protein
MKREIKTSEVLAVGSYEPGSLLRADLFGVHLHAVPASDARELVRTCT